MQVEMQTDEKQRALTASTDDKLFSVIRNFGKLRHSVKVVVRSWEAIKLLGYSIFYTL